MRKLFQFHNLIFGVVSILLLNVAKAEESKTIESMQLDCNANQAKSCVNNALDKFKLEGKFCYSPIAQYELIKSKALWEKYALMEKIQLSDYEERGKWLGEFWNNVHQCMSEPGKKEGVFNKQDEIFQNTLNVYLTGKSKTEAFDEADSVWSTEFLLGYMHRSEYDKNGNNLGIKKSNAVAEISTNGRWILQDQSIFQAEFGVILSQSGVKNDKSNSNTIKNAQNNDSKPTFNDVADSYDAYAKVLYSPSWKWTKSNDMTSIISFGALAGLKSRNVLGELDDSIVEYGGGVFEYGYYPQGITSQGNSIPNLRFSLSPTYFFEYGGAENELRWLIDVDFRPIKDSDLVLGVRANLGHGADDVGFFLGYSKSADDFIGFLGLK